MTQFFIAIQEKGKEDKPLAGSYSQAEAAKKAEEARQKHPQAVVTVNKVPERR